MAAKVVELEKIGPIHLYKRKGSRNIRLSFTRHGIVRVSLPTWLPYQAGIEFAVHRQDWIESHRPLSNAPLRNGGRIGKAHRLIFTSDSRIVKPTVRLKNNTVEVSLPDSITSDSNPAQAAAIRGAQKALLREAEQLLPRRLTQLANKHRFEFRSVNVKRLSSRWGSCSQHKDIVLNLFLMQLPWHLIDYVLVHELVHTEHLNHSQDFWHRFSTIIPNPKKLRKELRTYQTIVKSP